MAKFPSHFVSFFKKLLFKLLLLKRKSVCSFCFLLFARVCVFFFFKDWGRQSWRACTTVGRECVCKERRDDVPLHNQPGTERLQPWQFQLPQSLCCVSNVWDWPTTHHTESKPGFWCHGGRRIQENPKTGKREKKKQKRRGVSFFF